MNVSKPSTALEEIAESIKSSLRTLPELGVELGSGFASAAENIIPEKIWDYSEIPGFPPVSVAGHSGKLIVGSWQGQSVAVLSGRAHYYEGLDLAQITWPIRVLATIGVKTILFTNAAGAIHPSFAPGDFMALTDHLNFIGSNPLRGVQYPGQNRFVDLTSVYAPELRQLLGEAGRTAHARVHEGVYLAISGPSYETPAEIRAFRNWGADAVGMSTVPGAIVARQCGMRVAGLSCLTNVAAGLGGPGQTIDHETDVLATTRERTAVLKKLLGYFVQHASNR